MFGIASHESQLGIIKGQGDPIVELLQYHREQAASGDDKSKLLLGTMIFDGLGIIPKNERAGLKLFWQAMHADTPGRDLVTGNIEVVRRIDQAALNSRTAQYMRAIIYDRTPESTAHAYEMYRKAIAWDSDSTPVSIYEREASFHATRRLASHFMNADAGFPKMQQTAMALLDLSILRGDTKASSVMLDIVLNS